MKPLAAALAVALVFCVAACAPPAAAERMTLPTAPPPGPWVLMRDTLLGCAGDVGLVGPVEARVSFDADGVASSVGSGYGDAFARCVGNQLLRARFHGQRGRTLLIAFESLPR